MLRNLDVCSPVVSVQTEYDSPFFVKAIIEQALAVLLRSNARQMHEKDVGVCLIYDVSRLAVIF